MGLCGRAYPHLSDVGRTWVYPHRAHSSFLWESPQLAWPQKTNAGPRTVLLFWPPSPPELPVPGFVFLPVSLSSVYVCLSMVRTHCGFLPLAEHTSSYQPPAPPDHLIRRPLHKLTCETHFYRLLNYAIFIATNLIILLFMYRPSLEYLERLPELSE